MLSNKILDWISTLPLLSRGAESELRLGELYNTRIVFKFRRPKNYMDPSLDRLLRRKRTFKEAKIIVEARKYGVRSPAVLLFMPELFLIGLEYIDGITLKEYLVREGDKAVPLAAEAGRMIGILHKHCISHGDPTTSNLILSSRDGYLYLIDYGLADYTCSIEDLAVDLHLFRRAVRSTHPQYEDTLYSHFLQGYRSILGARSKDIEGRAQLIELRGRYVEERRTVWQRHEDYGSH